jgi:hypothetical protein
VAHRRGAEHFDRRPSSQTGGQPLGPWKRNGSEARRRPDLSTGLASDAVGRASRCCTDGKLESVRRSRSDAGGVAGEATLRIAAAPAPAASRPPIGAPASS